MVKPARNRIAAIVVVTVVGLFALPTACSNNAEGERCQSENGNDDCADGLTCIPKTQLVAPFNSADRCCPFVRQNATSAACKPGSGTIGNNPPAEGGADTGSPDTGATDAADASDAQDAADTGADVADTGADAPDGD